MKRKFNSPEELDTIVQNYKNDCESNNIPFLMTGLANKVGLSKSSFAEYAHKPKYADSYALAKNISVADLVTGGLSGKYNARMVIWILKANYGYR